MRDVRRGSWLKGRKNDEDTPTHLDSSGSNYAISHDTTSIRDSFYYHKFFTIRKEKMKSLIMTSHLPHVWKEARRIKIKEAKETLMRLEGENKTFKAPSLDWVYGRVSYSVKGHTIKMKHLDTGEQYTISLPICFTGTKRKINC